MAVELAPTQVSAESQRRGTAVTPLPGQQGWVNVPQGAVIATTGVKDWHAFMMAMPPWGRWLAMQLSVLLPMSYVRKVEKFGFESGLSVVIIESVSLWLEREPVQYFGCWGRVMSVLNWNQDIPTSSTVAVVVVVVWTVALKPLARTSKKLAKTV